MTHPTNRDVLEHAQAVLIEMGTPFPRTVEEVASRHLVASAILAMRQVLDDMPHQLAPRFTGTDG